LRQLGRTEESEALLRELLAYADRLVRQKATIDYFATSLPSMLLFNDDLQKSFTVTATFLQAQAYLGLGDINRAQQLMKRVMELDQNHQEADLLAEFTLCQARRVSQ
jgi:Tfp pilus assembly protein FimV